MATGVSEELFYSQSVSLQRVDSQTRHREGGSYSAAPNSVVYIKDSLPFGLNSLKHYDSFYPLRKIVKSSFATLTRETTETLNLYG